MLPMMLTESVSDPRRANWLTITSMSEDLSWPEEANVTRPSWELEAEILRLTTRLMMREREVRQVKNQLKSQITKAQQQATSWRKRMEEKEEQMRLLLIQKDAEMQNIVSQLLLFEAELRQEQSRIEDLLREKDDQILTQQKEIEHLKRCLNANSTNAQRKVDESSVLSQENSSKDSKTVKDVNKSLVVENLPNIDTQDAVQKLKDGLMKIRAIQDVTNVKHIESQHEDVYSEKRRVPTKAPQKIKDLKAKRINHHKTNHRVITNEYFGQAVL